MQIQSLPWLSVLVLGAFGSLLFAAEEVLGPMGGVGGIQRQAESRVDSPAPIVGSSGASAGLLAAPSLPADTAKKVEAGESWVIRAIAIKGDLAFAEKAGAKALLEAALVGEQPKDQQAVQDALRKLFKTFLEKKYYLARATLPQNPYDAQTQTLTVFVEAGLFGDVRIKFENGSDEGRWFSREQIAKRLKELKKGDTFEYQKLYDVLSAINAHPDLTLDTQLKVRKPVEASGDERRVVRYADLDFTVKESLPLHAALDINNYGTESVDNWQAALTLQYLNLTKADDVLTFSPAMSLDSSLRSLAGSYMRPHDQYKGGATTLYGGWSDLDCQDIVPNVDLVGTGWFVGLVRSYTLIEDEDRLISLSAGIVYRYIEDQFSAFNTTLQHRDITVMPLSVALSYSARRADAFRGRNFATIQGIYNLAVGGGNEMEDMRVGADDHYLIGRLQLARLQPVFGSLDSMERQINQWIVFLKAEGQYAACPLIPAEELALGGHDTVRGYVTKGYFGDNGAYGTAELRTPILLDFFSNTFGRKATRNPLDRIQFVVFSDAGYVETIDPRPGAKDSETLVSVGAGARLAVTQHSQLRLDVGVPVTSASGDDKSSEYYLDWQVQF